MMHLNVKELSDRWHMSAGTLQNWRTRGYGPKFIKWGKHILYPVVEVEAWEAKHLKAATND